MDPPGTIMHGELELLQRAQERRVGLLGGGHSAQWRPTRALLSHLGLLVLEPDAGRLGAVLQAQPAQLVARALVARAARARLERA